MRMVQKGDTVEMHYATCSLEGGVIETSRGREPLRFVAGAGEVLPGIDKGVAGMRIGERKRISIPSEQAFGRQTDALIESVPRSLLPENVVAGDQLSVTVDGTPIDVWVRKLKGSTAVIDANHPLAGEPLIVDVEVIGIDPAAADMGLTKHSPVIADEFAIEF